MKEDIHSDYNNTVNEVKYAPIQEGQEQIEITGVGEISDTESTASNVRRSYRKKSSRNIGSYNKGTSINSSF